MLNAKIKTLFKLLVLGSYFVMLGAYAEVRLWLSAASTDGLIGAGGRAGADAFCDADANNPGIAASTTRAFISVNGTDEIRDMAANYNIPTTEAIRNQDDTLQIAANFPALLDAGTTPLTNIVGGATSVYTGSNADGSLSASGCLSWNINIAGFFGETGTSNATNQSYITSGALNCSGSAPLYCISFTAPVAVSGDAELTDW